MADITMCKGENCPLKITCYRHIAKQNPHAQSWFADTSMYNIEIQSCEYYYEL